MIRPRRRLTQTLTQREVTPFFFRGSHLLRHARKAESQRWYAGSTRYFALQIPGVCERERMTYPLIKPAAQAVTASEEVLGHCVQAAAGTDNW